MVLALAGDSTITTFIQEMSLTTRPAGVSVPSAVGRGIWRAQGRLSNRADGSRARSGPALDVRVREMVAFVKQRSAGNLGLGVDEAVPEVEPRRMSFSLAIASEGFERDMGGFRLDWQAEHGFVNGDRGCLGAAGSRQRRHKRIRFRLAGKHRDDCRSVNDDHESPLRSS